MSAVAGGGRQGSGSIRGVRSRPQRIRPHRDEPARIQSSEPSRSRDRVCRSNQGLGSLPADRTGTSPLVDLHGALPRVRGPGEPDSRRVRRGAGDRIGGGMGDHGRGFRTVSGPSLETSATGGPLTPARSLGQQTSCSRPIRSPWTLPSTLRAIVSCWNHSFARSRTLPAVTASTCSLISSRERIRP